MNRAKTVVVLSSCAMLVAAFSSQAQDRIGPGSTVQGDILRGGGVFLRGAGMYDLYSAQGRRIDAGTEIMIKKWNMQVYDAYKHERALHMQYKKNLTNSQQAAARKKMAEKEVRLRTSPTDDDVVSGEALNALLVDLSDPTIGPSAWRNASVALPEAISIRSLLFRFATKQGDSNSGTLGSNLIALGRLDPSRGWPIFIPEEKVGAERRAYEATHRELLDQCEKDKLKLETVNKVDAALTALRNKVSTAVPPERKFREAALKYVGDMQAATKIFDASTIDFAQEMIRDTHDYHPQTVGELPAFLRKYRLFFASAAGRSEEGDIYRALFGVMRDQKVKLGLPMLSPQLEPDPPSDEEKVQGTWVLLRTWRDGKLIPGSNDPAKRVLLIFDGNRYVARNAQTIFHAGTWKLDASKTPRVLDRTGVNAKKEFVNFYGVYDWVDDNANLRMCWSRAQRPVDFRAPPGSGRAQEVFARTKP